MQPLETWVELEQFPGYAVSNFGRVKNIKTDRLKTPTPNQQGIPSVILYRDRKEHRRSVALLVASHFLPRPERLSFDTPINLDGDRTNNHVSNLEWRPRWFAAKYHAQFRMPKPYKFDAAVELVQTGEVFDDIRDCAAKYGLLENEIVLSARKHIPVFPTWQEFQVASH